MSEYVEIQRQEMLDFLASIKFTPLDPKRVYGGRMRADNMEVVYGKLAWCGRMQVSLRIFTSLPATEGAPVRKRGADAIRLVVVGRDVNGNVHPVSKPKRVYRVTHWRDNLQKAVDAWPEQVKYKCFRCQSPLTFSTKESKKMVCTFCEQDKQLTLRSMQPA